MDFIKKLQKLSAAKLALLGLKRINETNGSPETQPVAIMGFGCRFPGRSNTPAQFWENLEEGKDCITEIPAGRWDLHKWYHKDPENIGTMYTKYGGYLDDIEYFDDTFFKISKKEAKMMDPQQRLLLEVSYEALENSGMTLDEISGSRTGVFIGIDCAEYYDFVSSDRNLIDGYFITGNAYGICAGRLAFFYNLKGPSMAIDAGCSSSLIAIHFARQSLYRGECDLAIVGGVSVKLSAKRMVGRCKAKMISTSGRCRTFDDDADGYIPGEGCGVILLKRYEDAIRDRRKIWASIEGSATNQDGTTSSLTAPNGPSQVKVIQEAVKNANLSLNDVDYIETHGTGTILGDSIEIQALGKLFFENKSRDSKLILGSVKTNIGHLEAAAGMASIIKVIMSIQNKKIPSNLHQKKLNTTVPWENWNFEVPKEIIDWHANEKKRIAGISGFSFMGANCHLIIKEVDPVNILKDRFNPDVHLLTISAKNESSLYDSIENISNLIDRYPEEPIENICYTSNVHRTPFKYRVCFSASSSIDLKKRLKDYLALPIEEKQPFLKRIDRHVMLNMRFMDEAKKIMMDQDFFEHQTLFRSAFTECRNIFDRQFNISFSDNLFSEKGILGSSENKLNRQAILFTVYYALGKCFINWTANHKVLIVNDLSEYIAACIAGIIPLNTGIKLFLKHLSLTNESISILEDESMEGIIDSITFSKSTYRIFNKEFVENRLQTKDYLLQKTRKPLALSHPEPLPREMTSGLWIHFPSSSGCRNKNVSEHSCLDFTIEGICWNQVVNTIRFLYENGTNINWSEYYKPLEGNFILLPNYPFKRKYCWVDYIESEPSDVQAQVNSSMIKSVEKKENDYFFYTMFNAEMFPILNDHLLFDTTVVSGPTQITIILHAMRHFMDSVPVEINSYSFFNPIIVKLNESRESRITFIRDSNEKETYQIGIQSRLSGNDKIEWKAHSSGTGRCVKESGIRHLDVKELESIHEKCQKQIHIDDFYNKLRSMGYSFGNSFMCIETINRGDFEALCDIKESGIIDKQDEYELDPGLVDSCIQVMLAALPLETIKETNQIFVPYYFKRLTSYRLFKGKIKCHADIIDYNLQKGLVKGNIIFIDDAHDIVIEIEHFILKRVVPCELIRATEIDAGIETGEISKNQAKEENITDTQEMKALLREIASEVLEIEKKSIDFDDIFFDIGFESISFLKLSKLLKNRLDLTINSNLFNEYNTISKLADYVIPQMITTSKKVKEKTEIRKKLLNIISTILEINISEIPMDDNFMDYGFESISFLKLSKAIKEKLDIIINPNLYIEYDSFTRLADYIARLKDRISLSGH